MAEIVIRLSVQDLEGLIERAEDECYLLFRNADGVWVKVVPFVER